MKLKDNIVILTTDEMQTIIGMLVEYQTTLHKKTKGRYSVDEETERRFYNLLETSHIIEERRKNVQTNANNSKSNCSKESNRKH